MGCIHKGVQQLTCDLFHLLRFWSDQFSLLCVKRNNRMSGWCSQVYILSLTFVSQGFRRRIPSFYWLKYLTGCTLGRSHCEKTSLNVSFVKLKVSNSNWTPCSPSNGKEQHQSWNWRGWKWLISYHQTERSIHSASPFKAKSVCFASKWRRHRSSVSCLQSK